LEPTCWPTGPKEISDNKIDFGNPSNASALVKKTALFYGASIVGVCRLDHRWIYSDSYESPIKPPYFEPKHKKIDIPDWWKNVVVIGVEEDYNAIRTSPNHESGTETALAYSKMGFIASSLAAYIRGLGYQAIPLGNDTALSIPLAIDAGLGQLGRNGILITPELGPRLRICKVITNLPLESDRPIDFGVDDFCTKCKKCAKLCPSQAIPYDDKTFEGKTVSNNPGSHKWYVDVEKCDLFWLVNSGKKQEAQKRISVSDCSNCIRVCPWNKPNTRIHKIAKWSARNTPMLNKFFTQLDDALGYGKQLSSKDFWDK